MLTVLIAAVFVRAPYNGEPRYKGKKLSTWIAMYLLPSERVLAPQEQRDRVNEAVRHMGTNTIPYLLGWYTYDKHPRMEKADAVYTNLPERLRTNASVVRYLYADWKERRSVCAVMALAALDPQTLESNPAFARFISGTNTFDEWYRVSRLTTAIATLRDNDHTRPSAANVGR